MRIGIVTGASSGIGKEFVHQLENAYALDEIWLIARSEDRLKEIASRLQCSKGVVLPLDLTAQQDIAELEKKIKDASPDIQVLVNNAGYGLVGEFTVAGLDEQLKMIDLNAKAVVACTYLCLPSMPRGGVIFEVASISGFIPGPKTAVYSATKAFVLSFSLALYQELQARGIHVITVSPGPVATDFWNIATKGNMSVPPNAAQPADVVRLAIRDAKRGKLNSTHGIIPRLITYLPRLMRRKTLVRLVSIL
jgi:hypothetical protein